MGRRFLSLLVPFVILQALLLLLRGALGLSVTFSHVIVPQYGSWYFPVLFLFLMITPLLRKFRFLLTAAVLVAAGCFFLADPLPVVLQRAVEFYPFFLFGYYLSDCSFSVCSKPWFRWISVLFFRLFIPFLYDRKRTVPFLRTSIRSNGLYGISIEPKRRWLSSTLPTMRSVLFASSW